MKIKQAYISKCLIWFKDQWFSDYSLEIVTNPYEPVVMLGLYTDEDYNILKEYSGPVMVRWYGADALKITKPRLQLLKKQNNITHVTHIKSISDILIKEKVPHKLINFTESKEILKLNAIPRGDCIYHYGNGINNFYGDDFLPEIEKRTKLKILKVIAKTEKREDIFTKFYPECFIGLALTATGGTIGVMEQGLMGRMVINNNGYPNCIPWVGIDDICENIMKEYLYRHEDNVQISNNCKECLDTDSKWLEI